MPTTPIRFSGLMIDFLSINGEGPILRVKPTGADKKKYKPITDQDGFVEFDRNYGEGTLSLSSPQGTRKIGFSNDLSIPREQLRLFKKMLKNLPLTSWLQKELRNDVLSFEEERQEFRKSRPQVK